MGVLVSHANLNSAKLTKLLAAPGEDVSYYITKMLISGGSAGDGFRLLRQNCPYFAAANNTITVTDNAALEPADQDFSFAFWIKTVAATVSCDNVIKKTDGTTNYYDFDVSATGFLTFAFRDGAGAAVTITSTKKVNDGHWHLCIVTCDRDSETGLNLYIDGVAAATAVDPTGTASNVTGGTGNLIMAGTASKYFYLGPVGFYKSKVLSTTEIAALWLNGVGKKFTGSETGISAAWNLDEGAYSTCHDLVGSNNGTFANGVWASDGIPRNEVEYQQEDDDGDLPGIPWTDGNITATPMIGCIGPTMMLDFSDDPIKVGRNCPITIDETDGSFSLIVFGYTDKS